MKQIIINVPDNTFYISFTTVEYNGISFAGTNFKSHIEQMNIRDELTEITVSQEETDNED